MCLHLHLLHSLNQALLFFLNVSHKPFCNRCLFKCVAFPFIGNQQVSRMYDSISQRWHGDGSQTFFLLDQMIFFNKFACIRPLLTLRYA